MCNGESRSKGAVTVASTPVVEPAVAGLRQQQPPRPQSPPVVAAIVNHNHYDEDESCRACHKSNTLKVDWQQGDLVCTNCGVVAEGHLRDATADWRDYDNEDGTHVGAAARCGRVAVDESRYLGGLQPTTLSSYVYGNTAASRAGSAQQTRKTLLTLNRRMDRWMEKRYSKQLQSSRVSRVIRKRKREEAGTEDDEDDIDDDDRSNSQTSHLRPELDELAAIEEEKAANKTSLIEAEKWSLERAIRLFGSAAEQSTLSRAYRGGNADDGDDDDGRPAKETAAMRKAAQDLFDAYSLLTATAREMMLSEAVIRSATNALCRYAALRDGLKVRGVASTLKLKGKHQSTSTHNNNSKKQHQPQAAAALDDLREYNRLKQMGALAAAILFYTARNARHARELDHVCRKVQLPASIRDSPTLDMSSQQFIKMKHCSKAMTELKRVMPKLCQLPTLSATVAATCNNGTSLAATAASVGALTYTGSSSDEATVNFVDYAIHKLGLPPVAEACVRTLVLFLVNADDNSTAKLSKLCAATVGLISLVGCTMKRLAAASNLTTPNAASNNQSTSDQSSGSSNDTVTGDIMDESQESSLEAEQRAYEMRRVWDAWNEQPSWSRSLSQIEASCGVSRNLLLEQFKDLFPQRERLLSQLQRLALEQPHASLLLPHVGMVVQLIHERDLQ